jgi:membrane protease YdiL (CAAX protease family)
MKERARAAAIVIFLIIGAVLFFIFMNTFNKSGKNITIPAALPIIAIIVFYEGVIRDRDLSYIGVKKENFWRNVGIGVVVAFFGFFMMLAIVKLIIPDLMEEITGRSGTVSNFFRFNFSFPLNYILQTIYAFILLAPAEELLFRGFIQGKLQKWMNPYLAIGIQSVLFGLMHGIPAYIDGWPAVHCMTYGLIGLFGGILLGVAFYKTDNNIVAPWVAHAIVDSPLTLLIFGV